MLTIAILAAAVLATIAALAVGYGLGKADMSLRTTRLAIELQMELDRRGITSVQVSYPGRFLMDNTVSRPLPRLVSTADN